MTLPKINKKEILTDIALLFPYTIFLYIAYLLLLTIKLVSVSSFFYVFSGYFVGVGIVFGYVVKQNSLKELFRQTIHNFSSFLFSIIVFLPVCYFISNSTLYQNIQLVGIILCTLGAFLYGSRFVVLILILNVSVLVFLTLFPIGSLREFFAQFFFYGALILIASWWKTST